MVQNLHNNLIIAPELADMRRRLKSLDSKDGQVLFVSLYSSWCHNAVATFSLCLLAQAYEHASNLLQSLYFPSNTHRRSAGLMIVGISRLRCNFSSKSINWFKCWNLPYSPVSARLYLLKLTRRFEITVIGTGEISLFIQMFVRTAHAPPPIIRLRNPPKQIKQYQSNRLPPPLPPNVHTHPPHF